MEDIFKDSGIVDSQGNEMYESNLNPLMGYQIVHKRTGRLLPQCQRFEIMGKDYAEKKLASIASFYESIDEYFPFNEYIFEPVYFYELENMAGFVLLYTEKDQEDLNLFN